MYYYVQTMTATMLLNELFPHLDMAASMGDDYLHDGSSIRGYIFQK